MEQGSEGSPHLLDLPLAAILSHLPVRDLLRCSEACQALYEAGECISSHACLLGCGLHCRPAAAHSPHCPAAQDEILWQAKACELYPPATLRLGEAYGSWKVTAGTAGTSCGRLLAPPTWIARKAISLLLAGLPC